MNGIEDFEKAIDKAMDDLEDMIGALKDGGVLDGVPEDIEYVQERLSDAYSYLDDARYDLKDLHNASDKDYEGVGY